MALVRLLQYNQWMHRPRFWMTPFLAHIEAKADRGKGTAINLPRPDWLRKRRSTLHEYGEVLIVLAGLTIGGHYTTFGYRALGHLYLLAVIALSVRVGRWPVLFAAILSALAWNFVFIPPRLSFSVLNLEDALILGTYFVVALIAGQLTARIRAQELNERQREQRATALFLLTRALTEAQTLNEAVAAALRLTEELFGARIALLLVTGLEAENLAVHPVGSLLLGAAESAIVDWVKNNGLPAGRFTNDFETARNLYFPMVRNKIVLGIFVLEPPTRAALTEQDRRELIEPFVAQIALLVEREQLRAASEREKLSAESDRFRRTLLDSVSHELKTPLAVLRSASEELSKAEPQRRVTLNAEIRTATLRLDRLVVNLLSQTRLESGALKPQLDWCDVRDLIAAAKRNIGDFLADRPVKVDVPVDMPLFPADAVLMEQVLGNLILNAAVHTPAKTPIKVRTGTSNQGERVFIEVADRGPGISSEMQADLFQKFRRGKKAQAGGIGLGLSIVRGFMLAQGGDVTAENNSEGGAKFTIYLPLAAHENVPNE